MAKFSKLTQGSMTINGAGAGSDVVIDEISNTISDSNTTLITSDAVYTELQRIGYLPYGSPVELMISGALENQQYCDNPPDLRGLTFYVKYENSYHKYVPVTDSHITADVWEDNPYTYQTTTVTYTEDGVSVSNTIGAYCLPEEIVFQSGDFNPQGIRKSDLSPAISACFKINDVDYAGSYNILGTNLNYVRKCISMAPSYIEHNTKVSLFGRRQVITENIAISSPYTKIPAQSAYTYHVWFSRVFGWARCGIFSQVFAKGFRLSQTTEDDEGVETTSYVGSYGTIGYRCTDGPSGTWISQGVNYNSWSGSSDWSKGLFLTSIKGSDIYIDFGGVSEHTIYWRPDTAVKSNGGIYMDLTYPNGTVNTPGIWGIDFSVDTTLLIPVSFNSILSSYGDIIESPVVNISVDAYSSMGYGIVHISPEYPNWYAYDYNGSRVTLNPLYHYKSSHGSGIVKTIKSGTQLTYTDSEGSATTISSNIQEVSWNDSTATVKYKDGSLNDHTVTIDSDSWYRNYTLLIKANPTRSDGTTKY